MPGIGELADLIKATFGYCQIEEDIKTVPLSPPPEDLKSWKKGKRTT
jgi:hypothetical protein